MVMISMVVMMTMVLMMICIKMADDGDRSVEGLANRDPGARDDGFNNGISDACSTTDIADCHRLPKTALNISVYTGLNAQKL